MARVSDVREASRKDKERVAVQKRESSRQGMEKGLGVTFYKQGIDGPLSTTPPKKKKSSPKATAKRDAIQGDKKRVLERGFSPRDAANVKPAPRALERGFSPRDSRNVKPVQRKLESGFSPRESAKPKADTSNYVFSPMMGKMVPRGEPIKPAKSSSYWSDLMKRNWEKYKNK